MAQIIGTPRNDNLLGTRLTNSTTGEDDIFGLAGADRIDGRSGNDRLFGGPGADQLRGNVGDDLLFGEDDDDLLRGGPGDDQLFGGHGRDVLLGDDGDDLLAGDCGDDDLLGGSGDDLLEGGDGDDNLFGDAGDDVLDGGPGNNRLSGDADADRFLLADFDVDEILDLNLADGDVVDFSPLAEEALSAGLLLGDAVRLEAGPSGTTLLVDAGDSNRFQDVALLRGVDPVVEVISPGAAGGAGPASRDPAGLALPGRPRRHQRLPLGWRRRDRSGRSVSGAGDVNGDGFADLIVGASDADPGGQADAGESYVVFGGNFTGAVDGLGGEGDDIFIGTGAGEIFVGAQGDDTLIGNGGGDLLNGAAGDDLLAIGDLGFRQLAGGSGTDTVRLDGAGDSFDLSAISDLFVQDVERLDLNGNSNELALDTREILNIDDNSNSLTVFGDDTNEVSGSLLGAVQGTTTVDGVDFDTFTVDQALLLVQTGVDTSGIEVA